MIIAHGGARWCADSAGSADGIGSRYFSTANGGTITAASSIAARSGVLSPTMLNALPGWSTAYLGPLFADDAHSATALIETIVRSETNPILIDVVGEQREFLENLTGSGWTIERPFQRMRFGPTAIQSILPLFAVAGPEYG